MGAFGIGTATGADQAVAVPGGVTVLGDGSKALTTSDPLLQEDFENYSVGSFPNSWSRSGNSNQQVVDSPAASGNQALEMIGSYGGCWQALAHNKFVTEVSSNQTLVFSGHMRPTGTGGSGCHGNKNGNLVLQDSPSSAGGRDHLRKLIQFRADGTVSGSGLNLGSCQIGEYNSFEITYHWDSSAETVEVSYAINGENRGNTTVDAATDGSGTVVEADLVYLTVISGDYKLFVDNLLVTTQNSPTLIAEYVQDPPVVDGEIDESNWPRSPVVVTSINKNGERSQDTEISLAHDGNNIYFGVDSNFADGWDNHINLLLAREDGDTMYNSDCLTITKPAPSGWPGYNDAVARSGAMYDGSQAQILGNPNGTERASQSSDGTVQYELSIPLHHLNLGSGDKLRCLIKTHTPDHGSNERFYWPLRPAQNIDENIKDWAVITLQDTTGENVPPNASFTYSPDEPVIGDSIEFDASSSTDPDGEIVQYEWRLSEDGEFQELGEQFTGQAVAPAGEDEVTLRVTDDDGKTDTTTQTLVVKEPTSNIELDLEGETVQPGDVADVTISIHNEGSTSVGEASNLYAAFWQGSANPLPSDWRVVNEGRKDNGTLDSTTWSDWELDAGERESLLVEIQLPEDISPGEYELSGRVIQRNDPSESLATANGTITVEAGAEFEITAQSTTGTVAPGETTQLFPEISNTGDSSGGPSAYFQAATESTSHNADYFEDEFNVVTHDDDGGDWQFEGWEWEDVGPGETREPSIELRVAETVEPGEYTFRIEVLSGGSSDDTATATVTVTEDNTPPIAEFVYRPESPRLGDTITLNAEPSEDTDGEISSYDWTFQGINVSNSPREGEITQINATETDPITVSLTVADDDGATGTTTQTIAIDETLPTEYLNERRAKLDVANTIDTISATSLAESQAAEDVLTNYDAAYRDGDFHTQEALIETTQTLRFGEQVQRELLMQTSESGDSGDSQLAVQTMRYTLDACINVLMSALTFKIASTKFGDRIPNEAIDIGIEAVKNLAETVFPKAIESDIYNRIKTTASEAVNKVLNGEFDSADGVQSYIGDSIAATLANISLQREIETSSYPPLSVSGNPYDDIATQLFSVEDTLGYLHSQLSADNVTPNGVKSRLDTLITVEETMQSVSSNIETILDSLDSVLDNINFVSNIVEVLTALRNKGERVQWVDIAGAMGSLIPGSGLVVAGFRVAGSYLAKLAIQVLVTMSVFGTLVVIQGSPDNLPSPNEFLPNVDNVLRQIDSITSVWGGVQ